MSNNYPDRKSIHGSSASCSKGWFFITLLTKDQRHVFIDEAKVLAEKTLKGIPTRYLGWHVDTPIIMPNHIHLILISNGDTPHTLSSVIQGYKSLVYYQLRKHKGESIFSPWQRGYFEMVINSTRALENVRAYILANPEVEKVKKMMISR